MVLPLPLCICFSSLFLLSSLCLPPPPSWYLSLIHIHTLCLSHTHSLSLVRFSGEERERGGEQMMAGVGITMASAEEDAGIIPYVVLAGDGGASAVGPGDDDGSRLTQLGYKQELSRSLSAISNFAVTFSIVSILTGLTTTFDTGLTFGGPVTMIYGWPIVGVFTLIIGLSMAEICSSYPTSGGLYYWSAKLCGNEWGPFASWITG